MMPDPAFERDALKRAFNLNDMHRREMFHIAVSKPCFLINSTISFKP